MWSPPTPQDCAVSIRCLLALLPQSLSLWGSRIACLPSSQLLLLLRCPLPSLPCLPLAPPPLLALYVPHLTLLAFVPSSVPHCLPSTSSCSSSSSSIPSISPFLDGLPSISSASADLFAVNVLLLTPPTFSGQHLIE